jgi:hypothetical protein
MKREATCYSCTPCNPRRLPLSALHREFGSSSGRVTRVERLRAEPTSERPLDRINELLIAAPRINHLSIFSRCPPISLAQRVVVASLSGHADNTTSRSDQVDPCILPVSVNDRCLNNRERREGVTDDIDDNPQPTAVLE